MEIREVPGWLRVAMRACPRGRPVFEHELTVLPGEIEVDDGRVLPFGGLVLNLRFWKEGERYNVRLEGVHPYRGEG